MGVFQGYTWHDFVGNVGVGLIVGTYFLVQLRRMESRSAPYTLLNALGAVLILVSLLFDFNLSSVVIEIFWLAISLFGAARALRAARDNRSSL